jgi:hypothetical protein
MYIYVDESSEYQCARMRLETVLCGTDCTYVV